MPTPRRAFSCKNASRVVGDLNACARARALRKNALSIKLIGRPHPEADLRRKSAQQRRDALRLAKQTFILRTRARAHRTAPHACAARNPHSNTPGDN